MELTLSHRSHPNSQVIKIDFSIFRVVNIPLFYRTDTQYIHQNRLQDSDETRTRIVPLLDNTSRVKRDANSTDEDVSITTTTSTTAATSTAAEEDLVSSPLSPTSDNSSEQLSSVLKKELQKVPVRGEDDVTKNLQSHRGNLTFDNVSIERRERVVY